MKNTHPKITKFILLCLSLLWVAWAGAQTTPEAQNMELVAHHPLDGRPSYQPMPHRYGDRWILFTGHHAGEAINSLNGELEGNGTSVLDVTDPSNPVYLAHIPAPPWQAEGSLSLGTGAQHEQICNSEDLPGGTAGRVYMMRSLGNIAHEV
ncbi:MAG: hypothetical protein HOM55_07530, partial [Proteobacteria bacterium]|nr:hypothetical protein [Pseudomonadota bacterium]